jgi:MFS family permease
MTQPGSRAALIFVSIAELLAMSLWFSATAVLPELTKLWGVGLGVSAWLTMAVQLGYVAGALLIAILNLNDLFRPTRTFALATFLAALVNAAFAAVAGRHVSLAIALRFLTGALLAGCYPTGMKILVGWFRHGRGLALGIFIGAITVGKALPHLSHSFGHLPWREVILASSGLALIGSVIVFLFVREGPYHAPSVAFDIHQCGAVLRNRRARLANFGYLGHMWELYSMWGWIAVLLAASSPMSAAHVALLAFLVIASGAAGCVWAGAASDRAHATHAHAGYAGRARITIIAMAVSGACCLLTAAFYRVFPVMVVIAVVWGISVVADSAQFSTIVSEVSDHRYVGTALTLQTAMGFLLTTFSIRITEAIAAHAGWRVAVASLAIGPALGIVAMMRLQKLPALEITPEDAPVAMVTE